MGTYNLFFTGLVLGLFIGVLFGIFLIALVAANSSDDSTTITFPLDEDIK